MVETALACALTLAAEAGRWEIVAQLAEEHRRAGEYEDAIQVCRTGLEQHPGYLSARVTLGRALLETGEYADAQAELEHVLRAAPDNLAAIRALAELHQRREEGDPGSGRRPDARSQEDTETEGEALPELAAELDFSFRDPGKHNDLEIPDPELHGSPEPLTSDFGSLTSDLGPLTSDLRPLTSDPALARLESWLAAIVADREARLRASRFGGAGRA